MPRLETMLNWDDNELSLVLELKRVLLNCRDDELVRVLVVLELEATLDWNYDVLTTALLLDGDGVEEDELEDKELLLLAIEGDDDPKVDKLTSLLLLEEDEVPRELKDEALELLVLEGDNEPNVDELMLLLLLEKEGKVVP